MADPFCKGRLGKSCGCLICGGRTALRRRFQTCDTASVTEFDDTMTDPSGLDDHHLAAWLADWLTRRILLSLN